MQKKATRIDFENKASHLFKLANIKKKIIAIYIYIYIEYNLNKLE